MFGNTFRLGLASCGSRFIIYYLLFIYLFFYLLILFYFFFFLIYFLASIRSEFLLRGVPIYILVFVNLFIYLLIYFGAPWGSSFLIQLHVDEMQFYQQWNTLLFTGLLSVGECISSKTMVSLCFCLKWTSPWTLDTFLALFITHLCCSN